jgi:hypothetical protein
VNGSIRTRASNTMDVRSMAQVILVRPVVSQGGFVHTFPRKTKGQASISRVDVQCKPDYPASGTSFESCSSNVARGSLPAFVADEDTQMSTALLRLPLRIARFERNLDLGE